MSDYDYEETKERLRKTKAAAAEAERQTAERMARGARERTQRKEASLDAVLESNVPRLRAMWRLLFQPWRWKELLDLAEQSSAALTEAKQKAWDANYDREYTESLERRAKS